MNWYVLYTKSRSEKSVSAKLSEQGFEVYCPILKKKKQWSDRWKWVEEPLFRSYCFVRVTEIDRERVLGVQGVVRYVFHCGKPATIREKEMELLKRWLQEYDHESIEAQSFQADDQIIIKSGTFLDKQARVIESKKNHLVLLLKDLGIKVKVDLRKNMVEKIKNS